MADLDVRQLQKELAATGVMIHFDESLGKAGSGEKGEDFGHL